MVTHEEDDKRVAVVAVDPEYAAAERQALRAAAMMAHQDRPAVPPQARVARAGAKGGSGYAAMSNSLLLKALAEKERVNNGAPGGGSG